MVIGNVQTSGGNHGDWKWVCQPQNILWRFFINFVLTSLSAGIWRNGAEFQVTPFLVFDSKITTGDVSTYASSWNANVFKYLKQ